MKKQQEKCVNCGATWGQIFNNPRECSGGELPRKRHVFPDLTAATTQTGMEKRFEKWLEKTIEKYDPECGYCAPDIDECEDDIKAFIRSEITEAVEAERARIKEWVKKYEWDADGENMVVSTKDLLSHLTTLTKEESV